MYTSHQLTVQRLGALLVLLAGAFAPALAMADGRVTGVVTDAGTGDPLPGANVVVRGTSIGAATDLDGRYTIVNAPAGAQTLVVTYIGYDRLERAVEIPDGGTLRADFALSWEGVQGEEVIITAQASGQISAINQQLSSNTITNIVSADRIQELPDVNAAESIGRLPGVSIQRSGGEANKIAIRGLSPKYNSVTVNGVRVPSTGGDDRSVDLSLISSNMLSGIEVRKAITPDMDADAIGGSVDLRLREAPEGPLFDLLAQGGYNRLQSYYGNYKVAASASNRFLGGRLGAIGSFMLDDYDRSADKFSGNYRLAQNGTATVVTEVGLREESVSRGRAGGSLLLDYRIPFGKVTANSFYNRLRSEGLYRINTMNVDGNRHFYDLERRRGATSIFTGGVALEQDFNWVRYDVGVARTASHAESPEDFTWRFGKEGDVFTGQATEATLPLNVPQLATVDSSMGLQDIWVRATDRAENVTMIQLNGQLPFRLGRRLTGHVKAGGKLRWLDRFNDEQQTGRAGLQYGSGAGNLNEPLECIAAALPDWNLNEIIGTEGWLPIKLVLDDYARQDFLDGQYELGFTYDEAMMTRLTRALQQCEEQYRNNSIGSRGRDYEGVERYQAAYAMAEINLGRRVTLIPGVRWEGDYSRYQGQRYREQITAWEDQEPASLDTLTNVRENSFVLPMVHLQLRPLDWLTVRLARTETLTRPDYIQYAPITTLNTYNNYIRASNGLLKPAHAANYDAAVSVYQNQVGLFTVAGFYKSIDDLVVGLNYKIHPDVPMLPGMNIPAEWVRLAPSYGADTYINNPYEAIYKGVELDWQTNLWYLPSVLKGIVLNANYTYVQSEMKYQRYFLMDSDSIKTVRPRTYYKEIRSDSLRTGRMPDQPTHIANVTLGYDYKGFSTRLSFLYQSDVSTGINLNNPILDTFSGAYARWDLFVSQKLGGGFEMFANFNNLNGRPDRSFREAATATSRPAYTEYYGFTMDLGARYRF